MKRLWIVLALAVLAVATVWFWAPEDVVRGQSGLSQETVAAVPPASLVPPRSTAAPGVARVTTKRKVDARQRDAYLRRIADGVAQRGGGSRDEPHIADDTQDSTRRDDRGRDQPNDQPHPIKDKSDGELSDLMDAVSKDLMPLADECYEAALERDPSITGMVDINLEMVGDEDVGGIVESFELGGDNEIEDPEMIECIRETTLSTLFPAPNRTGRRSARLTLRFEPDQPE
ncbi:MAG: hypothetical protein KUG77_27715 [Nannocystaceae bacterium]|nr:hypothetical protein [Nannocystaceae bacterium]